MLLGVPVERSIAVIDVGPASVRALGGEKFPGVGKRAAGILGDKPVFDLGDVTIGNGRRTRWRDVGDHHGNGGGKKNTEKSRRAFGWAFHYCHATGRLPCSMSSQAPPRHPRHHSNSILPRG